MGFPSNSVGKESVLYLVQSQGQEDTLQKEKATHSSTLAWRIPWKEKLGRLQSVG